LVADEAVNETIRGATQACLDGDYATFRSFWSATADPVTEEQFEKGWRHAERIEVHKTQGVRESKEGRVLYYVHATVTLAAGVPNSVREFVLLVVKEGDRWRLTQAPATFSKRILGEGEPSESMTIEVDVEAEAETESEAESGEAESGEASGGGAEDGEAQ
jgi:hypothetical protein